MSGRVAAVHIYQRPLTADSVYWQRSDCTAMKYYALAREEIPAKTFLNFLQSLALVLPRDALCALSGIAIVSRPSVGLSPSVKLRYRSVLHVGLLRM